MLGTGFKLIMAATISVLLAGATPTAHAATRSCGSLLVTVDGKRISGRVVALRVSCTRARQVMKYALTHEFPPPGWLCVAGGAPDFTRVVRTCTRSRDRARVRLLRVS